MKSFGLCQGCRARVQCDMRKTKVFLVKSKSDMGRVAKWVFTRLFGDGEQVKVVLGLVGGLGAGKTTFVKYLAKSCGVSSLVVSPSFVLLRTHKGRANIRLAHIDAWRITVAGLRQIGFKSLIREPQTVVCVEWADRVKRVMPSRSVWIYFENISASRRRVKVCY